MILVLRARMQTLYRTVVMKSTQSYINLRKYCIDVLRARLRAPAN